MALDSFAVEKESREQGNRQPPCPKGSELYKITVAPKLRVSINPKNVFIVESELVLEENGG